jgi:hypothetical protein
MMLDAQNLLSDAQNLAQAAGTYLSTNAIDLWGQASIPVVPQTIGQAQGPVIKDIGRGLPPEILTQITTTFTSGGAATLQVQLVMADDAALSTNLVVLQETLALALATLVAGYQFRLAVPPGITKRYLGVRYIIGTAAMTAGNVTAGIAASLQTNPFVG